jgi:hypothetical protein
VIGADSIAVVLDVLRPERAALLALLDGLEANDWRRPGEFVGFFGGGGSSSPNWQAIAREYVERWVHHSQIRRALGLASLAERLFLVAGVEVAAAAGGLEPGIPTGADGPWALGSVVLGPATQTADILTRAHTADEVRALVSGPAKSVELLAAVAGRP